MWALMEGKYLCMKFIECHCSLLSAFVVLLAMGCSGKKESPEPAPEPQPVLSSECKILSMEITAGEWELQTAIDQESRAITIYCYDEDLSSLKSASCTLALSDSARVTPDPSVARNYTRHLTFVVTAEDGTEAVYTVSPEILPTPERPAKPVVMWIDAENSMQFLNTKAKIASEIQKAYNSGFSGIVVDVKSPVSGDVLYKSDFLGYCPHLLNTDVPQDFDFLQEIIDVCRSKGMTITASVSVMTMPRPATSIGQSYWEANLQGSLAKACLPGGIINQADDPQKTHTFLNPSSDAVHDYVMRMVGELASKYDLDGIALDYCRYPDVYSDFSDTSRKAFEEYSGSVVENFPEDIMTFSGSERDTYVPGPSFKEWVKWRASVIQGYVKDCRETIKAIKPSIRLECWTEGWWWDCWAKGQNWASQKASLPSGTTWAADDYMETGYAEYLDIYHLGAYVETVRGFGSLYTMEYLLNYAKQRILGACTMYGSFGAYAEHLKWGDAAEYFYVNADGMMIFELGSVRNRWGTYRKAIWRGMRTLGEYDCSNSD